MPEQKKRTCHVDTQNAIMLTHYLIDDYQDGAQWNYTIADKTTYDVVENIYNSAEFVWDNMDKMSMNDIHNLDKRCEENKAIETPYKKRNKYAMLGVTVASAAVGYGIFLLFPNEQVSLAKVFAPMFGGTMTLLAGGLGLTKSADKNEVFAENRKEITQLEERKYEENQARHVLTGLDEMLTNFETMHPEHAASYTKRKLPSPFDYGTNVTLS